LTLLVIVTTVLHNRAACDLLIITLRQTDATHSLILDSTIRYDTIEEFNVDSKAEYAA